jgi:hypothetical protein
MDEKSRLNDVVVHPIALAMQGMAVWHLLLGLAALAFTVTLVASGAPLDDEQYVAAGLTGAEVTGASLAAALILGGISWWMLGRAFWRPRWSVVLMPGLLGTLVTGLFELLDWSIAYLIGGAVAYALIRMRLGPTTSADTTNS